MNNVVEIGFYSKLTPVKPINKQMTLCKCYVMALGKNDNKSDIPKSAADDANPTLFNIPVVGHLFVDEDNNVRMGGHDIEIAKDDNGKMKYRVLTVPYGVVPQQDNVHYETVKEKNGEEKTYLVADVILWTGRYPELLEAKYSDEIYFAQSMEIIPLKRVKEGEFTKIEKYQYSALCLLGKSDESDKNVAPCFDSARVEPYDFSANEEWTKLFTEFKKELSIAFEKQPEIGGEKMDIETIKSILLEFNLSETTALPFEITEDLTEEMLREKLASFTEQSKPEQNEEPVVPVTEENDDNNQNTDENNEASEPQKFSLDRTYEEKIEIVRKELYSRNFWDKDKYESYDLLELNDVYAYCRHRLEGKDIDSVVEDLRIAYEIQDDVASIKFDEAVKVRKVWLTKEDENRLEESKKQLEELKKYKEERIEQDKKESYAKIIEEFSDLGEIEEYKIIVKDCMAFETEEQLSEKLYAIRGKFCKPQSKKPLSSVKIPVASEEDKKKQEIESFMSRYLGK